MNDKRPDQTAYLDYPNMDGSGHGVVVSLGAVRAADPVRITYDFTRDAWVIWQASKFEWDADDKVFDMDWQPVAYIQAWAREKET